MAINVEEVRKIKERAARALKKQDWPRALEAYQELCRLQPKDLRLKLKEAEILLKLKRLAEAMAIYQEIAQVYTRDKFLIQAISVYKLMQQIDPAYPGLAEKLEELNRARGLPPSKPIPAALPPDAEPGLAAAARPSVQEEKTGPEKTLKEEMEAARQAAEQARQRPDYFPPTPLFSALGEEEFLQVVSKFQVGTIPKNTLIIREGTLGDSFFIVSHGAVRVFRLHSKTGRKISLAHLKDGAFFGEMAFFLDSVRQASCETAEESVLLRINRRDLEELMERYPHIREVMWDFFKRRALDQLFKTMTLFETLEEAEQEVLAEKFEMLEIEPGVTLIREGEAGEYLWVIFSGQVEITATHPEKGPIKLAALGPGEYFGEISLVHNQPSTADVVTVARSLFFRLPRPVFRELLALNLAMMDELSEVIESRLEATRQALGSA